MNNINEDPSYMTNVVEIIGNKWNLKIIWNLQEETLRFTKLQKRIDNINSKTLTSHLRYLEKCNIIDRVIYPEVPLRVEYSLTEHGKTFIPIFMTIKEWGMSLPQPKNE
jgi:Predicted transcriptional regulators